MNSDSDKRLSALVDPFVFELTPYAMIKSVCPMSKEYRLKKQTSQLHYKCAPFRIKVAKIIHHHSQ